MQSLYSHETDVYNLKGFKPQIVDADYLKQLGVTVEPSEETLQGLIRGSKVFMKRNWKFQWLFYPTGAGITLSYDLIHVKSKNKNKTLIEP